jgi:hypothetical protein
MLPFESIHCPYCGESIELFVDDSVDHQQYVEDCQVCCRPIQVSATAHGDEGVTLTVRVENDA